MDKGFRESSRTLFRLNHPKTLLGKVKDLTETFLPTRLSVLVEFLLTAGKSKGKEAT